MSDNISIEDVLLYLLVNEAISPMRMNRYARDMEGPAPVAAV